MKKLILLALLSAALAGCHQQTALEAQQEAQQEQQEKQARIDAFQKKFESIQHVCDGNGGVKDYWTGRGSINVTCINGLQANIFI